VPLDDFDLCAQRSHEDLTVAMAANTLVPSMAHEMAIPRSIRGEIMDVVTEHFNTDMSSQDAVQRLVDAIQRAG
jgi:glucose/mannose transport system substrate-binding protein